VNKLSTDQSRRRLWLLAIGFMLFWLLACSTTGQSGASPGYALRPVATATPAPLLLVTPKASGRQMALPAPLPALESSLHTQLLLPLEEQVALVAVPTRDLRDLALRLDATLSEIPLVVNDATPDYAVGEQLSFWVNNVNENRNFTVTAELVHKTDVTYVWVEDGQLFDRDRLVASVDRFSHVVYPALTGFFGSEWSPGVDNDPRLHILHTTGMGRNLAGYYRGTDQYSRLARSYSNEKEMFFINLEWLNSSKDYAQYETVLAHEFQHMIHWYQDRNEVTWVNEGLSEYAQEVAGYAPDLGFPAAFARQPNTQLNSWQATIGDNSAHYGAAYLFIAYFVQRFGPELTAALVAHPANGIAGFNAVLDEAGYDLTFDDLFANWVVANYVDDPHALGADGLYGYHNFRQPPPALAATHELFPVDVQESAVYNYATNYLLLEGEGDINLHFSGEQWTRLANIEPVQGKYALWANQGDDLNTRLTRPLDLRTLAPSTPVSLTVSSWWEIEVDYDYGYVLASRDGATWDILAGRYTTTEDPGNNSFGHAYTGNSSDWAGAAGEEGQWMEDHFDLTPYAGEEIWLRFEYVTDDAVNSAGWFIDAVAIPQVDFYEDFDAPDPAWENEGWLITTNHLEQRWLLQLLRLEDNRLVDVTEIPVDSTGQATMPVAGLGGPHSAVLAVSARTPLTTLPANYEYWIERRP
jgi:immune inhibitor A